MILDQIRNNTSPNRYSGEMFVKGDREKGVSIMIRPNRVNIKRFVDCDYDIRINVSIISNIITIFRYMDIDNMEYEKGLRYDSDGAKRIIHEHRGESREIVRSF